MSPSARNSPPDKLLEKEQIVSASLARCAAARLILIADSSPLPLNNAVVWGGGCGLKNLLYNGNGHKPKSDH
jgi:hypothetical protein